MEIIPKRTIITIIIIGIILSTGTIFLLTASIPTEVDNTNQTGSTQSDTSPSKIGDRAPVVDIISTDKNQKSGVNGPVLRFYGNQLQLDQLVLITIAIILILMMGVGFYLGFRNTYNLQELREYIGNALELSGFEYKIGINGRQWQITDQFMLELIRSDGFKFKITLDGQLNRDPRLLGFHQHNKSYQTKCTIEALQLTLQRVARLI